jgi:hypothetical protein
MTVSFRECQGGITASPHAKLGAFLTLNFPFMRGM